MEYRKRPIQMEPRDSSRGHLFRRPMLIYYILDRSSPNQPSAGSLSNPSAHPHHSDRCEAIEQHSGMMRQGQRARQKYDKEEEEKQRGRNLR